MKKNVFSFFMILIYSSNIDKKSKDDRVKRQLCFAGETWQDVIDVEPRRGDILIGWNINHNRPAPGMGAASFWGMEQSGMNQKIQRTAR
jgi:hypothetical protein